MTSSKTPRELSEAEVAAVAAGAPNRKPAKPRPTNDQLTNVVVSS